MRDDEIRRRLRALESELESGNLPLRPARPDARRGVRMRPAAAGLGMAVSIAATVALFSEALPTKQGAVTPGSRTTPAAASEPAAAGSAAPTPATRREWSEEPTPQAGQTPPTSPTEAPPAEPACSEPVRAAHPPPDGISVTASVNPAQIRSGESTRFIARFRNETGATVINQEGNPRADFIVTNASGLGVWSYGSSGFFTQELIERSYADGEEAVFEITWDGLGCSRDDSPRMPLPPGRYLMRAVWGGEHGGSSEPIAFQIA